MSSMWRAAVILPVILAAAPGNSTAQYAAPRTSSYAYTAPSSNVAAGLASWRLRQSSGYSFSEYARFLNAYRDWPDGSKMRAWAERAMRQARIRDRDGLLPLRQAKDGQRLGTVGGRLCGQRTFR